MERKTKLGNEDDAKSENFQRKNSFRKVLPSKPSSTVDSRLSMSMKMIDRPVVPNTVQNDNKFISPFMLEYAVMAEYQMVQKMELNGVYVIPSDQDPLVWFGVIFIHQGLYRGGVFRFIIELPDNFPDADCPKVKFESTIFHPSINPETGELNTCEEFQDWNKKMNHVWQILQLVKRIFFKLETKNPFNPAAYEMFTKDNLKFQEMAKRCADTSLQKLYDTTGSTLSDDANFIIFEPYSESVHEIVKQQLTIADKIRHF